MHTVRLKLKTTAYDESVFTRRFHALAHIHNVLVKHVRKQITRLEHDPEYRALLDEYSKLLTKNRLSKTEQSQKKALSERLSNIRKEYGLTEYAMQSYIKVCGKRFRKLLSSQQIQKEATRVWSSVKKCLFSTGKQVHFKKYRDFNTISGKTNTNGVKFDKDSLSINWMGLSIPCVLPGKEKDREYLHKALESNISYCEIQRLMFPNGWHYYVIVVLKDDAPCKIERTGSEIMGIDPGVSTIAGVSDTRLVLQELAPEAPKYNRRIKNTMKYMDASKRAMNPEKYNPDGTINRANHEKWVYSKGYFKARNRLKSLYRQKSAYIKQAHETLCNKLLEDSTSFIVEDISYKALQHRVKKTERSDSVTYIKQNDGTKKTVRKYKKKKRYGRSLNNRSPALFLSILQQKCLQYGGTYVEINTKKFKASQYDHAADAFKKSTLDDRAKIIDERKVQRDLYSAFLIRNTDCSLNHADREQCSLKFEQFLKMQEQLINTMKQDGISMKQCFGF